MSAKIIDLEIRLLLLKHGRDAVLRALARAGDISLEVLVQQLDAFESRRAGPIRPKSQRPRSASVEAVLSDNPHLKEIVELFRSKRFLPNTRDVVQFLRGHGRPGSVSKRAAALPKVIDVLSELPPATIDRFVAEAATSHSQGYAALADEIMNPERHSD
jgi:hypothetical protein